MNRYYIVSNDYKMGKKYPLLARSKSNRMRVYRSGQTEFICMRRRQGKYRDVELFICDTVEELQSFLGDSAEAEDIYRGLAALKLLVRAEKKLRS